MIPKLSVNTKHHLDIIAAVESDDNHSSGQGAAMFMDRVDSNDGDESNGTVIIISD